MKKKILASFLLSLTFCGTVWASPLNGLVDGHPIVKVRVNGAEVTSNSPAMVYNDTTLLPLRAISESLGAIVEWHQDDYSVDVTTKQPALTNETISRISKSVALIYVFDANEKVTAQGSGFIIDDGVHGKVLITNYHVASKGSIMRVEVNGQVIGVRDQVLFKNEQADIWGVKIDTTAPSIPYVTSLPKQGDSVTAIGYPKGKYQVSTGVVNKIYNTWGNYEVKTINSSASINNGSSGGVLLNGFGEVIGITSVSQSTDSNSTSMAMQYVQTELNKLR